MTTEPSQGPLPTEQQAWGVQPPPPPAAYPVQYVPPVGQAQVGPAPYQPGYPGYPGYPQVAPKNPAVSLLLSFFFPGVGSMVNGDVGKGVGILIGYIVCCALFWLVVPIFGMLGLWIWGLVDAYQGAQTWNARHGIIS